VTLDLPDFEPRFPWWGGDLQTLRDTVLQGLHRLPTDVAPHSSQRRRFELQDGSGDVLLGMLDTPVEQQPGKPLVLLIHGAPGNEGGAYMLSMSRYMLDRGHRVLRLNQRGAGPSRATCRRQYSAGSSADLGLLFEVMPDELTRDGVVAVGYSLGGAVLLKHLGEVGRNTPLKAAAAVSAPIDLRGTCWQLMRLRNRPYQRSVLELMRREAMAPIAELTATERANIEKARTIREYDDGFTAARNGKADALVYYAQCSAIDYLAGIRVPTLCLAALDDPWVPGSAYAGYDWGGNRCLTPLLTRSGGHVGFHGTGGLQPWRDLAVGEFLRMVLAASETKDRLRS
jgi:predicted alpha/beta-fold hydrolase